MDEFPELTIGEVARRAGVATSSIRYYERIGLLPKPDRLGGQRRYDADVLGKLGFIGVAQSAGFKLREIKELIDGADGLGEPMRSLSSQKLGEVEALLERTKAMKGWLEVAQECGCVTPRSAPSSRHRARSTRATTWRCESSRWAARTVAGRPRAKSCPHSPTPDASAAKPASNPLERDEEQACGVTPPLFCFSRKGALSLLEQQSQSQSKAAAGGICPGTPVVWRVGRHVGIDASAGDVIAPRRRRIRTAQRRRGLCRTTKSWRWRWRSDRRG